MGEITPYSINHANELFMWVKKKKSHENKRILNENHITINDSYATIPFKLNQNESCENK